MPIEATCGNCTTEISRGLATPSARCPSYHPNNGNAVTANATVAFPRGCHLAYTTYEMTSMKIVKTVASFSKMSGKTWLRHESIIDALRVSFRFHINWCYSKLRLHKGDGSKLWALSYHVKLRGKIDQMSDCTYQVQPSTQHVIYFWWGRGA